MKNKTMELIENAGLKIDGESSGCIKRYTKLRLVDSEGYLYYLSGDNINISLRRGSIPARFFHNNPFTKENIENYIRINIGCHIRVVDFNNAKSAKDIFTLGCKKHNIIYERCWNVIKNGQYCNECGMEKYKSNRKNDIEKIKVIAREKYDIEIISDEYVNNLEPLKFICNKHTKIGIQNRPWSQIITSTHSCAECWNEAKSVLNFITHEEFMERITDDCKVYILGKYTGCKNKILVKCKTCGEEFHMRPDHITNEVGCGKCETSKGESKIKRILDDVGVGYIHQHYFGDCVLNKRDMPFDFYLPSFNLVIEYDGIQHFEPVEHFGGETQFIIQQENDKFKTKYCENNNIRIIRVPYYDYENIEEVLKIILKNKI